MRLLFAVIALLLATLASAAGDPPAPQMQSIKGEVLEVKDVDAYTYLRLKTKSGELWAAVSKGAASKGDEVTIENATMMNNFESKSLKKTFARIAFGTLAGAGPAAAAAGRDPGHMHGAAPQALEGADAKVPKALGSDARTVAEIVVKKTELKDKPVLVRGKVVKVTPNVMGKNWIHLRDGSGSAKDNTHDVLVTTKDQAQVGSIVVAKGVVRTDIDLGSGYSYKVLVDDATLQK